MAVGTPDDIESRILRAIAKGTHVDLERLRPEASLQDLAITSLDVINAVFEIEDEFGIEVPTDRDERLLTVADVVAKVRGILDQRAAG